MRREQAVLAHYPSHTTRAPGTCSGRHQKIRSVHGKPSARVFDPEIAGLMPLFLKPPKGVP
jgi:hypothetical protein